MFGVINREENWRSELRSFLTLTCRKTISGSFCMLFNIDLPEWLKNCSLSIILSQISILKVEASYLTTLIFPVGVFQGIWEVEKLYHVFRHCFLPFICSGTTIGIDTYLRDTLHIRAKSSKSFNIPLHSLRE